MPSVDGACNVVNDPKTEHAASAAALSLIAFCGSVACLIPPLSDRFIESPLLVVAISLAIAVSLILHLVFVGILARSLGKSPGRYVALALVTLPLGSIVALILLEWAGRHPKPDRPHGAG